MFETKMTLIVVVTFLLAVDWTSGAGECLFDVRMSGCGHTKDRPYHYSLAMPFTVSAIVATAELNCLYLPRSFQWELNGKLLIVTNRRERLKIHPAIFGLKPGIVEIRVTPQFLDFTPRWVPMLKNGTTCYVRIIETEMNVQVYGLDIVYNCDDWTSVELTSRSDYPSSVLNYEWTCPRMLCGLVPRNRWNLKFNTKHCLTSVPIRLKVTMIPTKHIQVYTGFFKSRRKPFNILLTCEKSCRRANAAFPLTLTAVLDSYDTHVVRTTYQWFSRTRSLERFQASCSEPNVLMIPGGSMLPGSVYHFRVQTSKVNKTFEIETMVPPDGVSCYASPIVGQAFVTWFSINCYITDLTQVYLYTVQENNRDILAVSHSPFFSNIRFGSEGVTVSVMDSLGQVRYVWVFVKLNPFNFGQHYLTLAEKRLRFLKSLSDKETDYVEVVTEINYMSRILPEVKPLPSFEYRFRILNELAHSKSCSGEAVCHNKMTNTILRLLECGVGDQGLEPHVDQFILIAGSLLHNLSLQLDTVVKDYPSAHAMMIVLEPLNSAIRKSLVLAETLIEGSTSKRNSSGWYLYFRKLLRGHERSRDAMKEMIRFVISHVTYPGPSIAISGVTPGENVTIIMNSPHCINVYSEKRNYKFIYSEQALEKWREHRIPIAVAFVESESHFFRRDHTAGVMGSTREVFVFEKHLTGRWSGRVDLGPIQIEMKVNKSIDTKVSHFAEPPFQPENNDALTNDRTVSVHRFVVPRGKGAVVIDFPPELKHKLIIYRNLSIWPTYEMVMSGTLVSDREIYKYNSEEDDNYVYIGILPKEEKKVDYNFSLSLIRCVTLSGDEWESGRCEYLLKEEENMSCICEHTSLLSVEISAPEVSLATLADEITILVWDQYGYLLLAFSLIIAVLLVFLCYAVWRDCVVPPERTAMFLEDNFPGYEYPYLIGIQTGNRLRSFTPSSLSIRLVGTSSMSLVHVLASSDVNTLRQGNDYWFVLFTSKPLGTVELLELWRNSTVINETNWYLDYIEVFDLKENTVAFFMVQTPLSTTRQYMAVLSVIPDKEEWTSFILGHLMAYARDGNHWTSVFTLHPRSMSTHLECFLVLAVVVSVTMLMCIVFESKDEGFSFTNFYKSVIAGTTAFLVASFIAYIFILGQRKTYSVLVGNRPGVGSRRVIRIPVSVLPFQKIRRNCKTKTAYVLSVLITFSCLGYTLVVGWHFSKTTTLTWSYMVLVALLVEALLNWIECIVMAILIAKATNETIQNETEIHVLANEIVEPESDRDRRLAVALKTRVQPMYKTPPLDLFVKPNFYIMYTRKMLSVAVLLILTLILVTAIRSSYDFDMVNAQRAFLAPNSTGRFASLTEIRNQFRYYDYLRYILIPSLHKTHWYQGLPLPHDVHEKDVRNESDPSSTRGFCEDYITKLVGVPRLRMKRIMPSCKAMISPVFEKYFSGAYGDWSVICDDSHLYDINWSPPPRSGPRYGFFEYWPQSKTEEGPVTGPSAITYTGGGYVQDLYWASTISERNVLDLQLENWIDDLTRVVILSFNLFNVNIERLSSVIIISEKLPSGVFKSRIIFLTDKASSTSSLSEKLILVTALAIGVVLILHVARIIFAVSAKRRLAYWRSITGITNLIVLFSGAALVVSFVSRAIHRSGLDYIALTSKDSYTPMTPHFLTEFVVQATLGLFSVAVAINGVLILGSLPHFKSMQYSGVRLQGMNITMIAFVVGVNVFVRLGVSHYGDVEMPDITYMTVLKETSYFVRDMDPGELVTALSISVAALIFLTHLNTATIIYSYLKADEVIRSFSEELFDFEFSQRGARVNNRLPVSTSPVRWSESVGRIMKADSIVERTE